MCSGCLKVALHIVSCSGIFFSQLSPFKRLCRKETQLQMSSLHSSLTTCRWKLEFPAEVCNLELMHRSLQECQQCRDLEVTCEVTGRRQNQHWAKSLVNLILLLPCFAQGLLNHTPSNPRQWREIHWKCICFSLKQKEIFYYVTIARTGGWGYTKQLYYKTVWRSKSCIFLVLEELETSSSCSLFLHRLCLAVLPPRLCCPVLGPGVGGLLSSHNF